MNVEYNAFTFGEYFLPQILDSILELALRVNSQIHQQKEDDRLLIHREITTLQNVSVDVFMLNSVYTLISYPVFFRDSPPSAI